MPLNKETKPQTWFVRSKDNVARNDMKNNALLRIWVSYELSATRDLGIIQKSNFLDLAKLKIQLTKFREISEKKNWGFRSQL